MLLSTNPLHFAHPLYYMQPNTQSRLLKEGSEYDQFWKLLGVKSEYSSQKIVRDQESDPHLFACTFSKGKINWKLPTAFID
jgi:hypothetical protein